MLWILAFESETDHSTFTMLYDLYHKLLIYKAYGILKDDRLAEDAASEAFIRIYKNLHKIDEVTSARTVSFIVTIVKNIALTMLSKEKKNAAQPYDEMLADDFNVEDHIVSALSRENVYALLNRLPEDLRQLFLLKFAHDLSHKEIGAMLGISENNVTVKLHRAKKRLIKMMQEGGYTDESQKTE